MYYIHIQQCMADGGAPCAIRYIITIILSLRDSFGAAQYRKKKKIRKKKRKRKYNDDAQT